MRALQTGDEAAIAALAPAALGATADEMDATRFAADACTARGSIPIPHGTGRMLVAGLFGSPEPAGLLYMTSPVRLIEESQTLGPRTQALLAREVREIELVATAPHARRTGIGSALLHTAQSLTAEEGVQIMCAKAAARDFPVLRWWRHRGYTLAQPGQNIRLHLQQAITCNDGHNNYRLAVRPLTGTVTEDRMLHVRPGRQA
ncbi:GNAT family N-acetyltransferase [Streptomyces hirsutus]|uniref:GNAT family N-acetyltransferase n=1 Tax=Streptomyces hirsutus TaxID=35620 RepID=UPI0033F8B38B